MDHFFNSLKPQIFRRNYKYNNFEGNRSNFNQESFVLDYFYIDWKTLLRIDQENVNISLEFCHLGKSVLLLILIETNKYKLNFKTKLWIDKKKNNSRSSKIYYSNLFTEKVAPVYKKDSKLDSGQSYHPISLLSNIEKFLKN